MKPSDPGVIDPGLLADLRAYHLPDTPAWWPPAPGWWLLAIVLLVAGVVVARWLVRQRRRNAAARQALHELESLRRRLDHDADAGYFARELSKLLRRFALARFARSEVAALTGEDWLQFLDRHGGDGRFLGGAGRQLVEAPYRAQAQVSCAELAALVEQWVRRNHEACP